MLFNHPLLLSHGSLGLGRLRILATSLPRLDRCTNPY